MTFLDLYREKYERRGGSAGVFIAAYRQTTPEDVVGYLLEHHPDSVRGVLIATATVFRDTGRTHCDALVSLLQAARAALTYSRLADDLPEPPAPFSVEQSYDVEWAVDRRDVINWVK